MQLHQNNATHHSAEVRQAEQTGRQFTPLHLEHRAAVETACAAFHLTRKEQTLRGWACLENGPLRPLRINGRLAWKTEDLRRLLGVTA